MLQSLVLYINKTIDYIKIIYYKWYLSRQNTFNHVGT